MHEFVTPLSPNKCIMIGMYFSAANKATTDETLKVGTELTQVNNTCLTSMMTPSLHYIIVITLRRSLAQTILHIFSNSSQNCLEIISVDEIMGHKTNVMIAQRIARLGKNRLKQDFSALHRSAAFFSMRGNLKKRLLCINPISSAPLFIVTSRGKRKPTGDKLVHNVRVKIFRGVVFFYYSKQSKHVFFSQELQQICINSTCK